MIEKLKKQPGLVALLLLVAAVTIFLFRGSGGPSPTPTPEAFFTVDDGKTFFSAPITNLPPFQHEGQEAVAAKVFTSDGGETQFVGFLEKYSDELKAKLETAESFNKQIGVLAGSRGRGTLVKRPGDAEWVVASDPRAKEIRRVTDDSGRPARAMLAVN
ncbi:MAG: hypothetical protein AAGI46_04170 [Planctomycetota bacterium]